MPALNTVDILLNGVVVAESVPLEYCMVFTRSLIDDYFNDTDMVVMIRKHEELDDG